MIAWQASFALSEDAAQFVLELGENIALALGERYEPLKAQIRGLAWLLGSLTTERLAELNEELLLWGDTSALSPDSLLRLARDYPTLTGRADRILRQQEVALLDARQARHLTMHFLLAKIESDFLRQSLRDETPETVETWWRRLLDRWHPVPAPQKVWLLLFVMSGLIDVAFAAFEEVAGTDEFRLSPTSTPAAGVRALTEWSEQETSDILSHVLSEILINIDDQRNGNPPLIDLAPIVLLLDRTRPFVNKISLCHSWMEPLAIFSAAWSIKPLEQMFEEFELPDGQTSRIFLADVLARAVGLIESNAGDVVFGVTGVRFKQPLSEKFHIEGEVPLEAVLLSARPDVTRALGPEIALNVGRFDGVLSQRIMELAELPTDPERRRALAQRAVASPMRFIRRTPGMLAYWGMPFALPGRLSVVSLSDLKSLLSEPDGPQELPSRNASDRLFHYAKTCWRERTDLVGQCARFPGVMGWQWAHRAVEIEDEEELRRAQLLFEHPQAAHFGDLWWAIATEWLRAASLDDIGTRQKFVESIEQILIETLESTQRGKLETATLTYMRRLMARFHAEQGEVLWLLYRLFGWWFSVAGQYRDGIEQAMAELTRDSHFGELAALEDAADPLQWWDGFDVRLASILNALTVCPVLVTDWSKTHNKTPWSHVFSSGVIARLTDIASADIGDEPGGSDTMDWILPLRPATAALSALFSNGGRFSQLSAQARERWLRWIPMTADEDRRRPRTVVLQLIHFAFKDLSELDPVEGALLADRCLRSNAPNVRESPITAIAIAYSAGRKLVSLDEAFVRATPHLNDTDIGRSLVAVYIDSVLDVAPELASEQTVKVLAKIGRDVSCDRLIEVVRGEPSFNDQEAVRVRLLKQLSPPLSPQWTGVHWSPVVIVSMVIVFVVVACLLVLR